MSDDTYDFLEDIIEECEIEEIKTKKSPNNIISLPKTPSNNTKGLNGKPETKDGFIRFSQELLQVLNCAKLNGTERGIFDVIFMETYGWGYRWSEISASRFELIINSNNRTIKRGIQYLLDKNIIFRNSIKDKQIFMYSINKYWKTWHIDNVCVNKIIEFRSKSRNSYKEDKLNRC